ncbi:helix-turn-helix domain-containing protein [Alkalihalobacillus sp. LMS6]|uniref:helix-turn-helix domain-containing protein n=1 Tax=Alkalihalobacillus sp. LMS6 TaxID=2924034 RepID=UPI0020D18A2B|nr:helix-turn-helix transcriptional regulator [Alkalihalobacillus sp. LMS6]UTR05430.1 helix-turn-helix domain-containing protein [Alkalihalobacillus sp. LMS6]
MTVIEKIKLLLEERDWTRYKLAKESKLPQSTITSLFSGRVKSPSTESLTKIAEALDVPVGYFLNEDEENTKKPKTHLEDSVEYFIKLLTDINIMELKWRAEDDLLNLFQGISQKYQVKFKMNNKDNNKFLNAALDLLSYSNVDVNVSLIEGLQELCEKHNVWINPLSTKEYTPYNFESEKNLIKNIDLNDKELKDKFNFTYGGDPLSEKEIDRLLAFIRMNREFDK